MKYRYRTSKNKDELTVDVTLPKIEEASEKYKVDSAKVLTDLKDKYDIITCIDKCTLEASIDEDVEGTMLFKVKVPKKKTSRRKSSTKKSSSDKEESE